MADWNPLGGAKFQGCRLVLTWNRTPVKRVFAGCLFVVAAVAQLEDARVGIVDFYGLEGLEASRLRASITVQPGERFTWPGTRDRLRDEAAKAAGRPVTHFSPVCCDKSGRWILYLGFGRGEPNAGFRLKPTDDAALPPDLIRLHDEFMAMLPASLRYSAGRADDYSKGYSISLYEPMRKIQLRMRDAAVAQEEAVLRVLASGADDKHRSAAALLAGYTTHSKRQIAALVDASRDPNSTVRNNATRSLGVLAATPAFASVIPPEPFIEKLNSPVWSDRNKALMLLEPLTRNRNIKVLSAIRSKALDALLEMARWQFKGHAANAIRLLGRIAGIPEAEVERAAAAGEADAVIRAVHPR